jgi:hypothetical protein
MKPVRGTLPCSAGVALLCSLIPLAVTLAADVMPGVGQQLITPTASSQVEAVLWTRRVDRYTLQVVLPRPRFGSRIQPITSPDRVTLWLLKADGTVIPARLVQAPGLKQGVSANEFTYSVPLSDGQAAVAAALRIGEEYFIEALRPLE